MATPYSSPLGSLGAGPIPGRYAQFEPTDAACRPRWAFVLNVPATASFDEIKRAYHALAALNHPDHGGSHEAMVEINKAYDEAIASIGNS